MKNVIVLTAICSLVGSAALAQTTANAPSAPQPIAPHSVGDITPAPQPQPADSEKKADADKAADSTKPAK